jgi:uncharacterized membrane protein
VRGADRGRLALATAAVVGITLADLVAGSSMRRERAGTPQLLQGRSAVTVRNAITVNRSPEEVYGFWRRFENLPRFIAHLDSVEVTDGGRLSHWRANPLGGVSVEWDAEIIEDLPNERIAWRSLEGSQLPVDGAVEFLPAPDGRGTEIHLEMQYAPPAGALGATIAKLLGRDPAQQAKGDLRRLKQVLETGEVVHSDSSIHAFPHPARPSEITESQRRERPARLNPSSSNRQGVRT